MDHHAGFCHIAMIAADAAHIHFHVVFVLGGEIQRTFYPPPLGVEDKFLANDFHALLCVHEKHLTFLNFGDRLLFFDGQKFHQIGAKKGEFQIDGEILGGGNLFPYQFHIVFLIQQVKFHLESAFVGDIPP